MISRAYPAAALAAVLVTATAPAALADVTAEQVWSGWRDSLADAGYTVTATEERSGGSLGISDVTMIFDVPQEDETVTMTMGGMTFTENGDGTVALSLPRDLPIDITVSGPEREKADIGLNYATTDLSITVSGAPDDMTYSYSAGSVGLSLERLAVEGEPVDMAEFGTAELTLADVSGTTRTASQDMRRLVQEVTTGAIGYLVDINEPEGGDGRFVLRGGADGMELNSDVSLPEEMDAADMPRMLAQGFAVDAGISITGGNSNYNFTDGDETIQGSSSASASSLRVAMNADRVLYTGEVGALEVAMSGGDLPFPVDLGVEEAGFNIDVPVGASEEIQDFALAMRLGGVRLSDMIWGMVDPAGKLPHDRATLAVDLSGTVRVLSDLFDPERMKKIDSPESVPGELRTLRLNDLMLSAAGAELTGAGAFTFDNSDLETFNGMPAPSGEVNLRLEGANTLLDKLVAMGLVPEDQASGARMMLGVFAVPAEGEDDTLTSTIEVKPTGQILANGQRIQ